MAVATEREYGLFINGELTEPQSGEVRELRAAERPAGRGLDEVARRGALDGLAADEEAELPSRRDRHRR